MLIAFYCTQFFTAQGNMIISLITRNIAGQTKKGTTMTLVFIGWSVGNLIAPQIFQTKDAPRYLPSFLVHIVVYCVYIGLVVLTRVVLMTRNRRKAAELRRSSIIWPFRILQTLRTRTSGTCIRYTNKDRAHKKTLLYTSYLEASILHSLKYY